MFGRHPVDHCQLAIGEQASVFHEVEQARRALPHAWHFRLLYRFDERYTGLDEAGRPIDTNRGLRRHIKAQFRAGSAYHVAAIEHLRVVNEGTYSDIMMNR
jgi:hypothetical protein